MNKQILNKTIRNETGSGLVLSLMVLLVLSVLGATLGVVTVGSYRLADNTQESNSAYYIAEAGANMAYEEIKDSIIEIYQKHTISENYFNEIPTLISESYNNFTSQFGEDPKASATIEGPKGEGDSREYKIISVGEVAGKARQVEKKIVITWFKKGTNGRLPTPPENLALAYTNTFNVGENFKAIGNILYKSNADEPNGVRFTQQSGMPIINNNIGSYQKTIKDNLINEIQKQTRHNINFNSLPSNGNIEYQHDANVSTDAITSNGTVKLLDRATVEGDVITKNGDIEIGSDAVVKGDIITDNGKVKLLDRARVEGDIITRNGDIAIGSQSTVEKSVKSSNGEVSLSDHAEVREKIITENSHITIGSESNNIGSVITGSGHITFGGNLKVLGNIITGSGKLTFANGVEVNGAVITGNGTLTAGTDLKVIGTIIVSSVNSNARMQVKYSEDYTQNFPFSGSNNESEENPNIDNLITSQHAVER